MRMHRCPYSDISANNQ